MTTAGRPRRGHVVVRLTDAEAVAVLVALDQYANELDEGAGRKDATATRATSKIEAARAMREHGHE